MKYIENRDHAFPENSLVHANSLMKMGEYEKAINAYQKYLINNPLLSSIVLPNLAISRRRVASLKGEKIAILCHNVKNNSLGRAHVLYQIYKKTGDVDILGFRERSEGKIIWEPLRDVLEVSFIEYDSSQSLIPELINYVVHHPYDVLHISKPRAINIIAASLYKIIWGSLVRIDVDDEEGALVDQRNIKLGDIKALDSKDFTSGELFSASWDLASRKYASEFDGVTVVNDKLRSVYGGDIIPHARDKADLVVNDEQAKIFREKFSLSRNDKVFLFLGTPRKHKGLKEVALDLASLNRQDIVYVIVGGFDNLEYKKEIADIKGIRIIFIENQPFSKVAEILSGADFVIINQLKDSIVSEFQTPAKISDALALGVVTFVPDLPQFEDLISKKAAIPIKAGVAEAVDKFLKNTADRKIFSENARKYFLDNLDVEIVSKKMQNLQRQSSVASERVIELLRAITKTNDFFSLLGNLPRSPEIFPGAPTIINKSINSKVKGDFNKGRTDELLIRGWAAEIGNEEPRRLQLKIGKNTYELTANIFRKDLSTKVNKGFHAFEFIVPSELADGLMHKVEVFDKESGKLIKTTEMSWKKERRFSDFSGFLASSLTDPLVTAPFSESDKRCFAIMEGIANHLCDLSSSSKIKWTVIMPVHNRITTVRAAIDSVLNQIYKNFELIVIDDCSSDGSYELVKNIRDQRISLLRNEKCLKVSATRNRGIKAAKGEYIAYLDSDNVWDERYLAAMTGSLVKCGNVDAVYGGQMLYRGNSENPYAIRYGALNKSLLKNRNYIDLNAFCHSKKIVDELGSFDENLKRYVDYDLICRIVDDGNVISVPVLLSDYFYDKTDNAITNDSANVDQINTVREKNDRRGMIKNNILLKETSGRLGAPVTVVIPSYESYEDTEECINSILELKHDNLKIVVVDNKSSPPVVEKLKKLCYKNSIKVIFNDFNYGFTYAVNQGIQVADDDSDIILMNNDALMKPGAVHAMQRAAYELAECGLVVPQQILPGGTKTISTHVPFARGEFDCDVNISKHHDNVLAPHIFHDGKYVELSFAPFFCVYIKRSVFNASRGLDAEFGRHYRSDRIYCDYIRHVLKLKIWHVSDAHVVHKLQKSTDLLRRKEKSATDNAFDLIFRKNQWDIESARKLNFKTAKWDF